MENDSDQDPIPSISLRISAKTEENVGKFDNQSEGTQAEEFEETSVKNDRVVTVTKVDWRKALKKWSKDITIEPMLFMRNAAFFSNLMVAQNFKLYKFCKLNLNYTEEECLSMNSANKSTAEAESQHLVNAFGVYEQVAMTVIPLIIMLFAGSWSDRHGRKPLMLTTLLGYTLASVVFLLDAIFEEWSAKILLVGDFLQGSGGGEMMFYLSAYSFMSDRTSTEDRFFRMAIMSAFWFFGNPFGTLLAAKLYDLGGYDLSFGFIFALYLTCFLYVIVFIHDVKRKKGNDFEHSISTQEKTESDNSQESNRKCEQIRARNFNEPSCKDEKIETSNYRESSRKNALESDLRNELNVASFFGEPNFKEDLDEISNSKCHCSSDCKSMFNLEDLKSTLHYGFTRRPGGGRTILLCLILAMLLQISSNLKNPLLWAQEVFKWSMDCYSDWYAINETFHQIMNFVITPVFTALGLHDCTVAAIIMACQTGADALMGCTTRPSQWWFLYTATIMEMSPDLVSVSVRSTISKVCYEDSGKAFSLLAMAETLWILIDKIMFLKIYDATLEVYPSAQSLVSVGFGMVAIILLLWLRVKVKRFKSKMAGID